MFTVYVKAFLATGTEAGSLHLLLWLEVQHAGSQSETSLHKWQIESSKQSSATFKLNTFITKDIKDNYLKVAAFDHSMYNNHD